MVRGEVQTALWSPDDWQAYCLELLHLHYGPDGFQPVPDRHQGDLGIEGFSRDGCVYQCYAPEEPYPVDILYKRQRDKITTDLGKLATNDADLVRLLGTVTIRRWILLVPRCDSRFVIAHATTKAGETRTLALRSISDDFEANVLTDAAFPVERAALISGAVRGIVVEVPDIDGIALALFSQERPDLVRTLQDKLDKIPILRKSTTRERFCELVLTKYIQGENILEHCRAHYPEIWKQVILDRGLRASHVEGESMLSDDAPNVLFTNLLHGYRDHIATTWPALKEQAITLAWGTMADWLIRCPLDFAGSSPNG
jgi:hypothetical protein